MLKRLCTAKIANARVTRALLHYEGSLGVDQAILEAAGILPYEMVLIANVTNGRRFETYTIPEPAGSRQIALYGGAAHMGKPGDELIIMAYGYADPGEVARFKGPRVVRLAPENALS
ncbi:MAG TPA: aspartate 1-decarboxylase [Planctomycetota bacterium]|jgi:aspartate 1-decarboxylase|nr:aspartate 1-decarboxylase [Planctomycetota bacterium]